VGVAAYDPSLRETIVQEISNFIGKMRGSFVMLEVHTTSIIQKLGKYLQQKS
jgi:hypothetical protein